MIAFSNLSDFIHRKWTTSWTRESREKVEIKMWDLIKLYKWTENSFYFPFCFLGIGADDDDDEIRPQMTLETLSHRLVIINFSPLQCHYHPWWWRTAFSFLLSVLAVYSPLSHSFASCFMFMSAIQTAESILFQQIGRMALHAATQLFKW